MKNKNLKLTLTKPNNKSTYVKRIVAVLGCANWPEQAIYSFIYKKLFYEAFWSNISTKRPFHYI